MNTKNLVISIGTAFSMALGATPAHAGSGILVCKPMSDMNDFAHVNSCLKAQDGKFQDGAAETCVLIAQQDKFDTALECLDTVRNKVFVPAILEVCKSEARQGYTLEANICLTNNAKNPKKKTDDGYHGLPMLPGDPQIGSEPQDLVLQIREEAREAQNALKQDDRDAVAYVLREICKQAGSAPQELLLRIREDAQKAERALNQGNPEAVADLLDEMINRVNGQ